MLININYLVASIVSVVVAVCSVYLVPYLKLKINANQWDMIQRFAVVAVTAAEQLGATKIIKNKYDYAFKIINENLKKNKIEFDVEVVEAAIEAAVRQYFPKK